MSVDKAESEEAPTGPGNRIGCDLPVQAVDTGNEAAPQRLEKFLGGITFLFEQNGEFATLLAVGNC